MKKSKMYQKAVRNFLKAQSELAPKLSKVEFLRASKNRIYFKVDVLLLPILEGGVIYGVTLFVRKKDLTVNIFDDYDENHQYLTDLFVKQWRKDLATVETQGF